eukprot:6178721-Pleurochrysis_carterae.AAC.3
MRRSNASAKQARLYVYGLMGRSHAESEGTVRDAGIGCGDGCCATPALEGASRLEKEPEQVRVWPSLEGLDANGCRERAQHRQQRRDARAERDERPRRAARGALASARARRVEKGALDARPLLARRLEALPLLLRQREARQRPADVGARRRQSRHDLLRAVHNDKHDESVQACAERQRARTLRACPVSPEKLPCQTPAFGDGRLNTLTVAVYTHTHRRASERGTWRFTTACSSVSQAPKRLRPWP